MEKVIVGNNVYDSSHSLKFNAHKFHSLFLAKPNACEFQRLLEFTILVLEKLKNFSTHENLLPQKQMRLRYN